MPLTYLPADGDLAALAKKVNARLPQGVSIDLYRIEDDAGRKETGVVYCCGPMRSRQMLREMLTIHDADRFVTAVTNWAAHAQFSQRWSEDPNEAS